MAVHPPTLAAGLAAVAAGLSFLAFRKRFALKLKESIEQFRTRMDPTGEPSGGFAWLLVRVLFPFLAGVFLLLGAGLIYRAMA